MAQSLSQVFIHLIFSTKLRQPLLSIEIEKELYAYIGGIIKKTGGIPLIINGTSNHLHILFSLSKTVALSKCIEDIKRSSSKWIKTKSIGYAKFAWQRGYAAFSVSSSVKNSLVEYILNQKVHHKSLSFKEEFLKFLDENGIDYDENYLWD